MRSLGQVGPISVSPNEEVTGIFTVKKIQRFRKHNQDCEAEYNYSYTDCLRKYILKVTNCNIDLLSNTFNCTPKGLSKLFITLKNLKLMTNKATIKTTGCLPKCTILEYDFQRTAKEKVIWKRDWISSFYLSTSSTTLKTIAQNYSYDEQVHYWS